MAKRLVRIKNVDAVTANLKKVFKKSTQNKKLLDDIGKLTRDRILLETRRGRTMADNKRAVPLPGLTKNTVGIRQLAKDHRPWSVDSEFFKPNRSNITFSGQLLESLNYIVKKNRVFLFFKDKREAFIPGDSTSNNKVYDDLVSRGFGFIGLDERGQKRVKKLVLDQFRRTIKNIFK